MRVFKTLILIIGTLFAFQYSNAFEYKIPFVYHENKIIVEVVIEKNKYNFIFDSGAASILDDKLVKLKKKKLVPFNVKAEDANEQSKQLEIIQLASVKLDKINFTSGYFAVADLGAINQRTCIPIAGIFGANLMNKLVWQIDVSKKELIVSDKNYASNHHIAVPFKKEAFSLVPHLQMKIRNVDVEVVLDTGASDALHLGLNYYTPIADSLRIKGKGFIATSLFGNSQGEYFMDTLSVRFELHEKFVFNNLPVDAFGKEMSLLGMGFLQHHKPVLDFKNNQLLIDTSNRTMIYDMHDWGFALMEAEGKLIVANVHQLPEFMQQLQVGMQIVAVDDLSFEELTKEKMCQLSVWRKEKNSLRLKKTDGTILEMKKQDFSSYF